MRFIYGLFELVKFFRLVSTARVELGDKVSNRVIQWGLTQSWWPESTWLWWWLYLRGDRLIDFVNRIVFISHLLKLALLLAPLLTGWKGTNVNQETTRSKSFRDALSHLSSYSWRDWGPVAFPKLFSATGEDYKKEKTRTTVLVIRSIPIPIQVNKCYILQDQSVKLNLPHAINL